VKRILITVVAALALAIPTAAMADDVNGGDQTANPSQTGSTNTGTNSSSQSSSITQTSSASSAATVTVTQNGGAGSNSSTNSPAAGDNSATAGAGGAGGTIGDGGDGGNAGLQNSSAGQKAAGNGGNGGDGGVAIVKVFDPAASGNSADVWQSNKQAVVNVAPTVQHASADYDAFVKEFFHI
jgi:hypothetical protein